MKYGSPETERDRRKLSGDGKADQARVDTSVEVDVFTWLERLHIQLAGERRRLINGISSVCHAYAVPLGLLGYLSSTLCQAGVSL